MKPLELLFERAELPRFPLPTALSKLYGGDLGIAASRIYANFVSSLDGVVALPGGSESGRIVSGDSAADRFVMALLRACADTVIIGAGTFRKTPGAFWHAAHVYPDLAPQFAALRKQLGLRPEPLLVLVTASGKIDTAQPALQSAVIATTLASEATLRRTLPAGARVVAFEPHVVPLAPLLELLRSEGLGRILTEGTPGEIGADPRVREVYLGSSHHHA